MQQPNTNLTKEDYQNLVAILDNVEIKGRKSAEYIAILALKLELRIQNWFDKHPSGFDIIETAKTSEAFEALVAERVAEEMKPRLVPDQYPEPNRNLESLG
jgi:hypothetical protein